MRWVWPAVSGVLLGLVASVIYSEFACLLVPAAGFLAPMVWSAWRRSVILPRELLMRAAMVLLTIAVCAALPFKYTDRHHVELTSDCVSVAELELLLKVRTDGPNTSTPVVCFTERSPTIRTVQDELLRQTNMMFQIAYCGTGATFLFGTHPIGRGSITKK
jgi:hypothetical protein